jgi:hypothetical protein
MLSAPDAQPLKTPLAGLITRWGLQVPLLAVRQQNLEEFAEWLERIRAGNANSEIRLRRVMEAYIDYWVDNSDHFRSHYSTADTIEDRRFPDGVYFGQTEGSRRSFNIFAIA